MALSTYARSKVWARDKGVCALCGADAGLAQRIMRRLRWKYERTSSDNDARKALCEAWGASVWSWDPTLWEADHVVPLAEGGTNDLSNYRTLCIPCHKDQTRALAGRLAAARRGLGAGLFGAGAPMAPQDIRRHEGESNDAR